jgi:Mrp family chromosome partitioning ATPase
MNKKNAMQTPPEGIRDAKHFLAVASGKGGVGKATVAVNLALALAKRGFRVGLLDADIYGPSIPTMLDLHEQPEVSYGKILPLEKFGLWMNGTKLRRLFLCRAEFIRPLAVGGYHIVAISAMIDGMATWLVE